MRPVFVATLALAVPPATATEAPREWTQEPDSVLGIKLGTPVADSPLPACARPSRDNNWKLPEGVCVEQDGGPHAEDVRLLDGLPWSDVRISGALSLLDGKVKSVNFEVNHADYEKFKAILISRYGAPATTEASTVTSNAGTVVRSETLQWIGKNVSLTVIERSGRMDRSAVQFGHNALLQQALDAQKSDIEKAAAKF